MQPNKPRKKTSTIKILFSGPDIEKLIITLEKSTIAKVLRTIDLLETFGPKLGMPHSRRLSDNLFELRIRGKQELRIFYSFVSGSIYLLTAFIKKSSKTPAKEINNAIKRKKLLKI